MARNIETGSREVFDNMTYRNQNQMRIAPDTRSRAQQRERVSPIGVMVLVALMGLPAAGAGLAHVSTAKRSRSAIGHRRLRRAMLTTPRENPGAPLHLEELLQDPRHPGIQRHLRKIYLDPVTGKAEWGLITGPGG
jgi:hypothetical protein